MVLFCVMISTSVSPFSIRSLTCRSIEILESVFLLFSKISQMFPWDKAAGTLDGTRSPCARVLRGLWLARSRSDEVGFPTVWVCLCNDTVCVISYWCVITSVPPDNGHGQCVLLRPIDRFLVRGTVFAPPRIHTNSIRRYAYCEYHMFWPACIVVVWLKW